MKVCKTISTILTKNLSKRDILQYREQWHDEYGGAERGSHLHEGVGVVPHGRRERRQLELGQAGLYCAWNVEVMRV